MRGTAASFYLGMRGAVASKWAKMRGTVPCAGMWVVWTPANRGSSVRDMSGKHAGSAAQVRLKRVEPRLHALGGPVFRRERHVKG